MEIKNRKSIVSNLLEKAIHYILKISPYFMLRHMFERIIAQIETTDNAFFTYHERPKKSKSVNIQSNEIHSNDKFAIVIQGSIIKDENFTLETVRMYKKTFSDAQIILSTWEDEKNHIAIFENENITIVLNQYPQYNGTQNINYQIVSSFNGIKAAKELGNQYVLKTRTDQRIYGINSREFLINIVNEFPVNGLYKQKKRIVGISLNTFKYRLYGMSDMLVFGDIDDMMIYWNPALDERAKVTERTNTIREFCNLNMCEVYLATEFLKTIGHELKWTLNDSWQVFADNFCIIDKESLDVYWMKYSRHKEYRYLVYNKESLFSEMSFRDWFNLYYSYKNNINHMLNIPESILDLPILRIRNKFISKRSIAKLFKDSKCSKIYRMISGRKQQK